MKTVQGDIWKISICDDHNSVVVVPSNVGWKTNGSNVMGAGLAKTAAHWDPDFPLCYGRWCKQYGDAIFMHYSPPLNRWLCAAPSKPLDIVAPHLSWSGKATIEQVQKSLRQIRDEAYIREHLRWYIPLLGAGNGGLDTEEIIKITESFKWSDNVTIVVL